MLRFDCKFLPILALSSRFCLWSFYFFAVSFLFAILVKVKIVSFRLVDTKQAIKLIFSCISIHRHKFNALLDNFDLV